jgi:amidohydrolase
MLTLEEDGARLRAMVAQVVPEVVEIRRDIHTHPELAYQEKRTAKLVADWLVRLGMEVREGVAGTGVVGLLRGAEEGETVALRADMDALPLQEETGLPYASQEPGRMHACGHDGHTAMLMGTAKVLSRLRSDLKGNVKFIFQPAEEGGGGGKVMCDEGVLEAPRVGAIFALHDWPDLEVGEIGTKRGVIMANTDQFRITIRGKGGHAARPQEAIDAVVMAAQVVQGLQTIVSRRVNPLSPVVVTVGKIEAGSTHNIIAGSATLLGTVRTLSEESREQVMKSMRQTAEAVAMMFEAPPPELEVIRGYPATVNDDGMTDLVTEVAKRLVGEDMVRTIAEPSMGGEDFSFYLQRVPGSMFRLGIADRGSRVLLHTSKFDFDDRAIGAGMLVSAGSAIEYLSRT